MAASPQGATLSGSKTSGCDWALTARVKYRFGQRASVSRVRCGVLPVLLAVLLQVSVLAACGGESERQSDGGSTRTYPLPEGAYMERCRTANDLELAASKMSCREARGLLGDFLLELDESGRKVARRAVQQFRGFSCYQFRKGLTANVICVHGFSADVRQFAFRLKLVAVNDRVGQP